MSVQECPVEAWVDSGLPWGQGHWIQRSWPKSFWRRTPYHGLASCQTTGREHSPTHQQKIGLKIYLAWPCPSEQDQDSPQPVPTIRKFPQTSYPYPSEGRQNGNYSYRELTKLITWITALSNSVKLWAMKLRRATQDGRVMVESSDKMWSTREGNGKSLQYSYLENPMNILKWQKVMTLRDVGAQYVTGEEWRSNSRKNEEAEPKQKQHPVVVVSGDGSQVRCCKEQYCIGTWNVRSMNQGK